MSTKAKFTPEQIAETTEAVREMMKSGKPPELNFVVKNEADLQELLEIAMTGIVKSAKSPLAAALYLLESSVSALKNMPNPADPA